jgi:hypothetical protein
MSIEVAAQGFLFSPYNPGFSSSEIDRFRNSTEVTEIPFSHNHLHDLESLWWVAVWVVFFFYFSKGTPSRDHPSFTLQDVEEHLDLARILFPHSLKDINRRNAFQAPTSFPKICSMLSGNKKDIYAGLNVLRRLLISHYSVIEEEFPLLVDPSTSNDDIYDNFTQLFFNLKIISHDLVLDFIPHIYEKLLKEEKSKSTGDSGVAQTNPAR